MSDGNPVNGKDGVGCRFGHGGKGGRGARAELAEDRTVSDGGNGGRGFPGETIIVELENLSVGDLFEVSVGNGGGGGLGGSGFVVGDNGGKGIDGSVIFVPILCSGENI